MGFLGDEPSPPHEVLRRTAEFLADHGGVPAARETVPLVVIGGGMSGLATAWLLRDLHPVVLEQAAQFGGNSKAERWNGIEYALGAAYLAKPEPGSELQEKFYGPLGADRRWREASEDPVVLGGRLLTGFWEGTTDPGRRPEFERARAYFLRVLEERYPDVPWEPGGDLTLEEVARLDESSFRQDLERELGTLHPHIETLLEHYCWSTFGGSLSEISAAAALNSYAAEFGGICALPGGNAAIADTLLAELARALPAGHLRPGTMALDVRLSEGGVQVVVTGRTGDLGTIEARAVVMACPKLVAKRIIPDLAADQRAAMNRIRYRAYVVANLLLTSPAPAPSLDVYLLGDGTTSRDTRAAAALQGVTDVVIGHWAQGGHPTHSVLTLYRAFPFDDGTVRLLDPDAHGRLGRELAAQVPALLAPLGVSPDAVSELRIARWGHALPLAEKGLIADGTCALARRAIGGRVFFIEQDNWPQPAIETVLTSALQVAPEVRAALG